MGISVPIAFVEMRTVLLAALLSKAEQRLRSAEDRWVCSLTLPRHFDTSVPT